MNYKHPFPRVLGTDVCSSNFTPNCHISLPYITKFVINATTKEVNPHPCIAPCINMWSVTFLFFHLLNVGACICHIARESQVEWTTPHHSNVALCVIPYRHKLHCSIVSRIHVNTTKLCNITCTLVGPGVILQSSLSLSLHPTVDGFHTCNKTWYTNRPSRKVSQCGKMLCIPHMAGLVACWT